MKSIAIFSEIPLGLVPTRMLVNQGYLAISATDGDNVSHLLYAERPLSTTERATLQMPPVPPFQGVLEMRDRFLLMQGSHGNSQIRDEQSEPKACVLDMASGETRVYGYPGFCVPCRISQDGESLFLIMPSNGQHLPPADASSSPRLSKRNGNAFFGICRISRNGGLSEICRLKNVSTREIEQTVSYDRMLAIVTSSAMAPGLKEIALVLLNEDVFAEVEYESLPRYSAQDILLEGATPSRAYGAVQTPTGQFATTFHLAYMERGSSNLRRFVAQNPQGTISIGEVGESGKPTLHYALGVNSIPLKSLITSWPQELRSKETYLRAPVAIDSLKEVFLIAQTNTKSYIVRLS